MKVLHVIPSFAPAWRYGGPVRAAFELSRELASQGVDTTVFTTNIDGDRDLQVPLDRPVRMDGFEVRYYQVQSPRSFSFSLPLARALGRTVRHFDVVHIHSLFNWPITPASHACRQSGVPYIVRPCGILDEAAVNKGYAPGWESWSSRLKKETYLNLVDRRNIEGAAAIHYTCEEEAESSRWAQLRCPTFVCPLGFREEEPGNRPAGIPGNRKILLYLSRLDPKKGLDPLLKAFSLLGEVRKKWALVVAGDGEERYATGLRSEACRLGLGNDVVFLGEVRGAEKWALLHGADAFALPSHRENFGIAAVEALGAGCPVILTKGVGIHREVVRAGAGTIAEVTVKSLAGVLRTVLTDAGLRKRQGMRARELARSEFAWPVVTRRLIGVYEDLRAGRNIARIHATG